MLPSLAGRLIGLVGLICGCAAFYLWDWDRGPHGPWPQILMAGAVAALFAMRAASRRLIDEVRLKAAVGDTPVRRLSIWRGVGIVILMLDLIPVFGAALIDPDAVRHGVMIGAAATALIAMATLAWVEARYRGLIRAAGGLAVVGKP
jgi:hypothetical protein